LFPIVSDAAGSNRQTESSPHGSDEQLRLAVKSELNDTEAGPSHESEPQPGLVITICDILYHSAVT